MREIQQYVSSQIKQQFPEFYRSDGPDFIQFVKGYFEWMESNGQPVNISRNLFEYRDIDTTIDDYLSHFQDKYMAGLPTAVVGDRRFLQKHILDVYRSKGSVEGLKLLFRLLYNEDVELYIPSYDILKTSDGKWIENKYLEITFSNYNNLFQGQVISGAFSGATALVEQYEQRIVNGRRVYILFISNIEGQFAVGEVITYSGLSVDDGPTVIGSIGTINITGATEGHAVGDQLVTDSSNTDVLGIGAKFTVTEIRDTQDGIIEFTLVDGGFGYSANAIISIVPSANGTGASFVIGSLSNTSTFVYNTDLIDPYTATALNSGDYGFPAVGSETLATIIDVALTSVNVEVGTIQSIITTDSGTGYDGDVTVTITDPYTASAYIDDGAGGYWGQDANVLGQAVYGSGVVTAVNLKDSGFGYFVDGQLLTLTNSSNTLLTVTGNAVFTGVGSAEGYWKNTDGFLNSDKYLQDSYYYQEFSYEVRTIKQLSNYADILKQLVHPVGNQLFGRVVINSVDTEPLSIASAEIEQV